MTKTKNDLGVDWPSVMVDYISGTMTNNEICDKHGLKGSALRNRASRNNWNQMRDDALNVVTETAVENIIKKRSKQLSKWNDEDIRLASAVRRRVARMIDPDEDGNEAHISPNQLRLLTDVLDKAQKIGRLAFGLATEATEVTNRELPFSVHDWIITDDGGE